MIVSSAYGVGVSWIGLLIAERELDNTLYCCMGNGRYISVINMRISVHLHHPADGPYHGRGDGVVVALSYTPMGSAFKFQELRFFTFFSRKINNHRGYTLTR